MQLQSIDFHTPEYMKLYAEIGGAFNNPGRLAAMGAKLEVVGIHDSNGALMGVFNLYNDTRFGLAHLKVPPYSPHIGLVFRNPASNISKQVSFAKSVYRAVEEYIAAKKAALITLAVAPEHNDMQVFIWKKYKVVPNYTYQIRLKGRTLEEIRAGYAPERRNDIKKAYKDGVTVNPNTDYGVVKAMVLASLERKEKGVQEELLQAILDGSREGEDSYSFVSSWNDKPSAAAFVSYDTAIAYYSLGGYDVHNRHQGAGAMAVDQAVERAWAMGKKTFDFEGSMLPEVEHYFRGFGGELVPYLTLNRAWMGLEMALKFVDRSRF